MGRSSRVKGASKRGPKPSPLSERYTVVASGCWLWNKPNVSHGYGDLCVDGKTVRAHRYFYEQAKGPIPEGKVIRHLCHDKRCVNPAHLAVGTAKDNAQDMLEAGRWRKNRMQRAVDRFGAEGVTRKAAYRRWKRYGWPLWRALMTPIGKPGVSCGRTSQ